MHSPNPMRHFHRFDLLFFLFSSRFFPFLLVFLFVFNAHHCNCVILRVCRNQTEEKTESRTYIVCWNYGYHAHFIVLSTHQTHQHKMLSSHRASVLEVVIWQRRSAKRISFDKMCECEPYSVHRWFENVVYVRFFILDTYARAAHARNLSNLDLYCGM